MNSHFGEIDFEEMKEAGCLGAIMTSTAKEEKEIYGRLSKENRYMNCEPTVQSAKFEIYKAIFRLTLLYLCRSWALNKNVQKH